MMLFSEKDTTEASVSEKTPVQAASTAKIDWDETIQTPYGTSLGTSNAKAVIAEIERHGFNIVMVSGNTR